MSPLSFIILLLLLPSMHDALPSPPPPKYKTQTLEVEAMIRKACTGIANRTSCVDSIRIELEKMDPPGARGSASVLHAALKATLNEALLVIQTMSNLAFPHSEDPRQDMAIEDCKELLDFSVSEIAWSMSEMRMMRAGAETPRSEGNLMAWLSAALSNQDTCLEGFEGTDGRVEKYINGSLMQITQLVSNVLAMYTEMHSLPFRASVNNNNSTRKSRGSVDVPTWMTEGDRELLLASPPRMHVDAVVAADGSGRFRTITDAVMNAPNHGQGRYVIYVKRGIYRENVDLKKKKTNIMLVGDGIGQTVITGDRNFLQGWTTFRTATFAVSGMGFIARDMTFRNTAGPGRFQAVALRVDSDQSAFFRCSMEGYQDTLYAHSLRQFFRECNIYGTVDFIFGNGAAVLQSCNIFTQKPLPQQKVTLTAQGRKTPHQTTGFVIQDSHVLATSATYLGRPWKQFSRTVFMNTYMSSMVQTRGWLEWYGSFALNTLYYGEYRNYGPGASLSGRVRWPGFHVIRDAAEAGSFTVAHFIDGMSWLPSTGIRFSAGLSD